MRPGLVLVISFQVQGGGFWLGEVGYKPTVLVNVA